MKVCLVLLGPIAGNGGIIYNEGEEIILENATAALFEGWNYVEILREADDGSAVAGRVAEPTPTEPVAQSPLPGGDLPAEVVEPKVTTTTTRKSKTTSTVEA